MQDKTCMEPVFFLIGLDSKRPPSLSPLCCWYMIDCFCSKHINSFPLSTGFSVTWDSLSLFSGKHSSSHCPVSSRALRVGLNKSVVVLPSCLWDLRLPLLLFHLILPFVSSGLWQPGYEAEAVLHSRLHWLADVQSPRHVAHHASLSAALWLPWWVKWCSFLTDSEFHIRLFKNYQVMSVMVHLMWEALEKKSEAL